MGRYFAWTCPDRKEFIEADDIGGSVKLYGQGPALWAVTAFAFEGPWRGRDVRLVFDENDGAPMPGPSWDDVHDGSWTDVSREAKALADSLGVPLPEASKGGG